MLTPTYNQQLNITQQSQYNKMDIKDFQGLTKFKLIVPTIYVCSWLCMILGPVLFQATYTRICVFVLIYIDIKILLFFFIMIIVLVKSRKVFKRITEPQAMSQPDYKQQLDTSQQLYYAFVLPNYMEEVQMMAETLDLIASHKRAKQRYLIFMAMQAHQQGSDLKAQELIGRYKQKFRLIDYTRHEVRPNEQKGKASNVSWCVEHLQPVFEKNMIDPDQVFITVVDADSWAPDLYIDIVEQQIIKNYQKRYTIMFQPPQIFTRNNLKVPVTTRVFDLMHSYLHCSNLFSFFDFTFPISNYTLSYNLIKRIGFWDTCADAIGEDFHTTLKAYWKTNGQFKAIPVYVPFNQVNISTGDGYVEDVLARFWQSQRHAQGCADLPWTIKMLLTNKFRPMNLFIFFLVFEIFVLPAVLSSVFLSLTLQSHVLYFGSSQSPDIVPPLLFTILINIMSIVSTISYFMFEYFKRRANKLIYHQENQSIFRVLEYPIIFTINMFFIMVPTFIFASFSTLMGKTEYIVAMKKNTSKSLSKS